MTGTSDDAISMDELAERGRRGAREAEWEERWSSVEPDDICTFIYTSGTTGPPKGCVISHGNYRAMLDMVIEVDVARRRRAHLPLPAARALVRAADPARHLRPRRDARLLGARPAEDPPQPRRGQADLLPVGAADLREDLHRRDLERREGGRRSRRRSSTGRSASARRSASSSAQGKQPGPLLRLSTDRRQAGAVEDPRPVRRQPASSRSPARRRSTPRSCEFFDAAGVLVLEGWGMTETSTAATIATPEDFKFGHRRQAVPGLRDQDRRRRRDPRQGPEHLPGLLQERGGDRARRSSTAGCTPATSARSTPTATSRSPAARRTSSSPRAARTSPRPTSRPRSSSTRSSPSAW